MALAVGAVTLLVLMTVVAAALRTGPRPEESVAAAFVSAMLAGDGEAAYELTTPAYRLLVRPSDLAALAEALRDVAGADPDVDVVGSERTPGPPTGSLVGYTGRTVVGPVEGVVTLLQLEPDGPWLVHDLSYRFPEADPADVARLREVTRRLNEALAERAAATTDPDPAS